MVQKWFSIQAFLGLVQLILILNPKPPPPAKRKNKKEGTSEKIPTTEEKNKKEESDLLESKPKQTKGANWCVKEDKALCRSWLNTLKDATTGTDQTKPRFWQQIHKIFVDLMDDRINGITFDTRGPLEML
ncbi:hypothetical protein KEM48_000317 [Puccinia striiformis f. sp. tritici PST-130]|uniref:Uncharacterized protein n=1 Tax=Puccinia striiformis f. sp. tritici PST-78 TaxID=1165861 RepID=A0A0L0VP32_9BASI|nr:hypothetical protein KEM48_000317 [Puccinia striiformis f. sp. tritici PST-130]KAI9601338.1 hypothetical protein H4Q26_001154 [Puccinia striiformis f. sp. tritici PST-130]KNF01038.1 hypothetical protein PSTG_05670 [Puccinia striiformis f. sp. tritici PST-78]